MSDPQGTAPPFPNRASCIHCVERPGVVSVPIDDETPEGDQEIRAWSCVECVHKRVRWADGTEKDGAA